MDSARAAEPRLEEMRVVLHAPEGSVHHRVTSAMLACSIPLAQAGEGVFEARYGDETGIFGQYSLTTHVYVVAFDDSTTLVRLSGTETSSAFDSSSRTGSYLLWGSRGRVEGSMFAAANSSWPVALVSEGRSC